MGVKIFLHGAFLIDKQFLCFVILQFNKSLFFDFILKKYDYIENLTVSGEETSFRSIVFSQFETGLLLRMKL